MKLTAKNVAGLTLPPGKKDHIEWDDDIPRFGYRLRLSNSGDKVLRSWIVQYRRPGKQRKILLGSATVIGADMPEPQRRRSWPRSRSGQDPQAEKAGRLAAEKFTLSQGMIEPYLAETEQNVRSRSFTETQRYLRGDYFKPLLGMPADSITRRDVAERVLAITRENGHQAASNARGALSALFTWGMANGLVQANPVAGTARPKTPPPRDRVLSDAELAAIWRAAGDDNFGRIVRLLMLSAQRRTEVGGICWSEINFDQGTWTIPALRSKNHRAHTLPLPPLALDIIAGVKRVVGRNTLFGDRADSGLTGWARPKAALDDRLGDQVGPWRLHDLRRSAATRMCDLGVAPHVVEQILNHQSGHRAGIVGVYNRSSYEREVRAALALWNDHIRALVKGGDRKIVPMQRVPR